MKIFNSCAKALNHCLETKTYGIAHLYNTEKTMDMHVHNCYEIYFSLEGGKQFLINDRIFSFSPGDIFFINMVESHHVQSIEPKTHERIVIHIHPSFIKQLSNEQTDLEQCFIRRDGMKDNKRSLSSEEQKRFLYFIHELSYEDGYGRELLDDATMIRLLVFLNGIFIDSSNDEKNNSSTEKLDEIISYINQNLTEEITLQNLSEHFFISSTYLCNYFKKKTGTTIIKYITAQRITLAKTLLLSGSKPTEVCEKIGFVDYSNFFKAFKKATGVSPYEYSKFSKT